MSVDWSDQFFHRGGRSMVRLELAGGMVCLNPRCEPDWEYTRACADKRCTQNKVMMFGSVLRAVFRKNAECHLYVWREPSAAYPLLINTPALTDWSFSPSFLIISDRLYQRNCLISSPKHTFISQHPPPFSAAGRSGVYLNPLLSEHWRGERQWWGGRAQIIMVGQLSTVRGAGELGGEEDYGGNGSIPLVNFWWGEELVRVKQMVILLCLGW